MKLKVSLMFNVKEFEIIYKFLIKKKRKEAQKNLVLLRDKYTLHPDYLFLMAEHLILEDRVYQAIDTLHSSLLIDYDDIFLKKNNFHKSSEKLVEKKFKLFHKLFKKIDNVELAKNAEEANTENEKYIFFKRLQDLMPGIGFKEFKNN